MCPRLDADVYTGRSTQLAIREAITAMLGVFDRFEVDETIYGDVRSRYKTLLKRLTD